MEAESQRRSAWILVGIIVAILGIGVSIYSIHHHLEVHAAGHTNAACNINSTFSCDTVALSKYSEVMGVPLGVFGLGYFAAIVVLLGIVLRGGKSAEEHLHGYALLVVIGVLTSLVLGGISLGMIGAYCPSCMVVYALTLIQAGVLFVGRKDVMASGFTLKSASNGATSAAIVVAVVVAGFNFLRPSVTPAINETSQASQADKPQLAPNTADIPLSKSPYSGLGEDYRRGSDSAKVVIQEFADFECPACGHMATELDDLHKEFGDKVLMVFRNYPLDQSCNDAIRQPMHKYACHAAVMARCAGQYGKFWEYFDLAYAGQASMSDDKIKQWGKQVGLTDDQINTCWNSPDIMAKIKDDVAEGNHLNIDSTPTLYLNGHKVIGSRGIDDLRADINGLLQ